MDLKQLVARPELVKITINDEDTIREFGEAIDFWTWNRQPLDVFLKLSEGFTGDQKKLTEISRTLILDSTGQPVMTGDELIPTSLMVRAVAEILQLLGK